MSVWRLDCQLKLLTPPLGPRALAPQPPHLLRRFLSTEADSIHASAENSLKQLQSIEAQLNTHLAQPVPSVDPETHGTPAAATDNVAEQYRMFKQQSKQMGKLGAVVMPHYQPHTLLNHPRLLRHLF